MKSLFVLLFLVPGYGFTQAKTEFQKHYVAEGLIVKGFNHEPMAFMIVRNAKLGISAITDENGYFSVTFPMSCFKNDSSILFDLEKNGLTPGKIGISYNPINNNSLANVLWSASLYFIRILEKGTKTIYQPGAHRRINIDAHGYSGIRDAVNEYIEQSQREDKIHQLMAGNQDVLFKVDGKYVLTTLNSITWLGNEKLEIYLHEKRVRPKDINKLVKREDVQVNSKRQYEEPRNKKVYKWFLIPSDSTERELMRMVSSQQLSNQ